jgi:hypothetical protein
VPPKLLDLAAANHLVEVEHIKALDAGFRQLEHFKKLSREYADSMNSHKHKPLWDPMAEVTEGKARRVKYAPVVKDKVGAEFDPASAAALVPLRDMQAELDEEAATLAVQRPMQTLDPPIYVNSIKHPRTARRLSMSPRVPPAARPLFA